MRWLGGVVVACLSVLVNGLEVRGDGFPGRLGATDVKVCVRFDGLEDYPEYDFYVKYARSRGNPSIPAYIVPVSQGHVQRLAGDGQRMSHVVLLVVPRGQKPVQPRDDPSWLSERFAGEMQSAPLPGISGGVDVNENIAGYIVTYRVAVHDGKVEVTPGPSELVNSGEWVEAHPIMVLGCILAAIITLAGWVLVRLWKPWRLERPT